MDIGTSSASGLDRILKDATPCVDVAKKVVSPFVIEESAAKESLGVNTLDLGSNPPLPLQEANLAGNAPGKPSYANSTGKSSGTKVNFHTLYTPRGNGIDVVIPVDSIRAISERFTNNAYGFFLGKWVAYPVVANYVRNTLGKYGLVKLHGVPVTAFSEDDFSAIATKLGTPLMLDSYTTNMCMHSWGRSSYARAMIELRADVELKDNIVAIMPKIVGKGYYTCNIRVEYKWKPPRIGYQWGSTHLASQEANYSESSFWNAESSSPSTTPIMEKINKMENLIIDGKAILVDNKGKPLSKVDEDSEDEVASVDNDMANFLAKNDGYGTQSLLKQWKDSYDDYEYDPYDDDLYEGQGIPEMLQAFCDNLDIKVIGRKKK
ncbi:hypothetical protein Tco_0852722 [Tanacetum coccineum]